MTLTDFELAALVGRRFRGGVSTVEHWENCCSRIARGAGR